MAKKPPPSTGKVENFWYYLALRGEVAEWSKAAVLKTVEGLNPPRVRIPASPP
jgi:hypothetical protein